MVADMVVDGVSVGAVQMYTFDNVTGDHTVSVTFMKPVITATAGPNGQIFPSGAVEVNAYQPFTVGIVPDYGYMVADVIVDGVSVGPVGIYTFDNVMANHIISASFTTDPAITYTITATAGAGGSISPSGTVSVNGGSSQTFTITPITGSHVNDVLVDGVSVGAVTSYTFNNISANHTISASFYNMISAGVLGALEGGTISPSGGIKVNYGGSQTFTITPNAGYHIEYVAIDGVNEPPVTTYTFTNVTADHSIYAYFRLDQFPATSSAGANGTISPSGTMLVTLGESRTYIITPNAGYEVADVVVDGSSVGAVSSYTFTNVTTSHTISATFVLGTYTITASAGTGGAISPSGGVTVNGGGSQTFNITPDAGYHVADIVVDGSSVGAVGSYTFTSVIANHTISATFAINTYTITASSGGGGAISPSGAVTVNYAGSQEFTITPNAGYNIADVLVDGSSVGAVGSYTFTNVNANHSISATFAINTYTITASAGAGGAISPSGAVTVNYGGSQTYSISATTGYHVADVLVDGSSVGAVGSYTFTNVLADHTISATFVINTYTITASAWAGGSISPSGTLTMNYGDSQTFTITPDVGYSTADVIVDGVSRGPILSITFNGVNSNHSIAASFIPRIYTVTSPNGGENWTRGTTQSITWSYTGTPSKVKIELLRNGALVKTITTWADDGSNGSSSYSWAIPSNQATGTNYQIRITRDGVVTDTSDGTFTISR